MNPFEAELAKRQGATADPFKAELQRRASNYSDAQAGSEPYTETFARSFLEGIPIVGPLIAKGTAYLDSKVRGITPEQEAALGAQLQQQHPIVSGAGTVAGGIAGTAPLAAAAPVLMGVKGPMLASRLMMGATSGGAISGADAYARGENVGTAMASGMVGGALGSGLSAAAGRLFSTAEGRPLSQALKAKWLEEFPTQELKRTPTGKAAYKRVSAITRIENVVNTAEQQASVTKPVGDILQREFLRLTQDKRFMGGLNEAERAAINDVVKGSTTADILRLIGKLPAVFGAAGLSGGAVAALSGSVPAIGAVAGGVAGGAALSGMVGRRLSDQAARAGAQAVQDTMAAGRAVGPVVTPNATAAIAGQALGTGAGVAVPDANDLRINQMLRDEIARRLSGGAR